VVIGIPHARAIRRDEHDRHNRKVVRIQDASDRLLGWSTVFVRAIEGALAAMTPVAFAARAVVVGSPRINILALAPGTLQGPVFPSQGMDVGLTLFEVKELM
jgi:hypothetical protein